MTRRLKEPLELEPEWRGVLTRRDLLVHHYLERVTEGGELYERKDLFQRIRDLGVQEALAEDGLPELAGYTQLGGFLNVLHDLWRVGKVRKFAYEKPQKGRRAGKIRWMIKW